MSNENKSIQDFDFNIICDYSSSVERQGPGSPEATAPQINVQEIYLTKHACNKTAEELVFNQRREMALYNKYKNYYGYVFYIAKKIKQ